MLMNAQVLAVVLKLRRMSAAELARRTKLSRQAVSKWLSHNDPWVNVESNSMMKVSKALDVDPALLIQNLFPEDQKILQRWRATLLWDHLYESLESFVAALCREELPAVARYVQTFGILSTEKIFGKKVFKNFHRYAKYIHPAKRKELEVLCRELQALALI